MKKLVIVIIVFATLTAVSAFNDDKKLKIYISDFVSENIDGKELKLIAESVKYYFDQYNVYDIVDKDELFNDSGEISDFTQGNVLKTAELSGIQVVINVSVVKSGKKYVIKLWAVDSKSGVVKQSVESSTANKNKLKNIVKKICFDLSFGDARNSIEEMFEKKVLALSLNGAFKKNNSKIRMSDFISDYQYDTSTEKGRSFLNGYLKKKIPADYIYCSYDSSKLSNIYLIFHKNNAYKNAFANYESLLIKYLGANFTKEEGASYWKTDKNTAELITVRLGDADYIVIHYYVNDNKLDFDDFTSSFLAVKEKLAYKKNLEFQIGGGYGNNSAYKFLSFKKNFYNNNILEKVEYDKISSIYQYQGVSFDIPFSFSCSINSANSLGFSLIPSYIISFSTLGNNFYDNNIMFNLLLKYKYGEYRQKSKFLLEFGANLNYEYFCDLKSGSFEFVNYNADYDKINLYIPRMYLAFGPSLLVGAEYNNKNFYMAFASFIYASFGFGSYDGANLEPESLNINISLGTRFRIGYRGLVFVK
ncbi:MAG TPA: hypothetical protein PK755_10835 [Spirochaetota bacterium]|nr:hypothetical protein [Spirochaetota bacterium]